MERKTEARQFEKTKEYVKASKAASVRVREEENKIVVELHTPECERHIVVRYYPKETDASMKKDRSNSRPMCYKMYYEIVVKKAGGFDTDSEENWFTDEAAVVERLRVCDENYHRHGWC